MASFTVSCECGEHFHGDDRSAGRRVRCRRCGRAIELMPPRPPAGTLPPVFSESDVKRRRRRTRGAGVARVVTSRRVRRALDVLGWGYLAAALLVALAMWTLGDRWWPATILVFMGRWVFLLPLAALVPAALVLRRRLLLPLALGALVTLGPVMGARTGWRRLLAVPGGMPLRVVTFNAEGGRAMATELPLLLEVWKPDVVLFQECGEELATAAGRMAGWHAHHDHMLCMLSRFPIASAEPMDRSALERIKQDAAGVGGAGYVVRYALATPDGTVNVANLHLETPRKGFEGLMSGDVERLRLNTTLRDIESNRARRWVDGARGPTIVAGDFNTPVESTIFQRHWGDLADAFSQAGTGLGMTKYNGWIRIRIDHVLADRAWWHVARARVGDDLGSDHRPLIVDLVLVQATPHPPSRRQRTAMSQSGQGGRHRRAADKRSSLQREGVAQARRRARLRGVRRLASTQDFTSALAPDACVIITAGHRNATGGGAPGEMARTPKLARAYRDALRAAGLTVFYVQELDNDGDPDTFAGNLTAVAATVRALAAGFSGNRLIMLDLHLEEGDAPRGVFTIVPDDPTGKSADVWKNNVDAVTLGHLLSDRIAARAGFTQRAAKELGVMSERQTGVGESGSRLGMFRGTAALRDRMTRLIVEHGNIVKDLAVIDRPETPALCASAAVEAVSTFLGIEAHPPIIMA